MGDKEYGTFLRLKRRANIPAATSILLEGLADIADIGTNTRKRGLHDDFQNIRFNDEVENDESNSVNNNTGSYPYHQPLKRRPALWKLVSASVEDKNPNGASIGNVVDNKNLLNTAYNFKHKRIVTAILEETSEGKSQNDNAVNNQAKRRKLAIVDESTTETSISDLLLKTTTDRPTKKKGLKILHPLERMVDESLKEAFSGDRTPRQHFDFISNDSIFTSNSSTDRDKCLLWSNIEYGNILHACATWNDVTTANELFMRISSKSVSYSKELVTSIAAARNTSGQTPYDVAQLSGHLNFCDLLKLFGAVYTQEDEYEYDLYYLIPENQQEPDVPSSSANAINDVNGVDAEYVTCELQNGQTGYWNEDGELVLELDTGRTSDGALNTDDDDDDEDSNRESWVGNDYPDEEEIFDDEENQGYNYRWSQDNYADDDSSYDSADKTFRNHRYEPAANQYDSDGLYDPAYGIFSSQPR